MSIQFNQDLIEKLSSKVHDAWWEEKKKQGFHSPADCKKNVLIQFVDPPPAAFRTKHCDKCHTDMYPYDELPENVKDYDRVTVKTVLGALLEVKPELVKSLNLEIEYE
ncbi:MAG: hypothetical protein GWN62_10875 [Aliifodinibius sp.]|nr:hypothetical protein [Fodinibius sp.]